MVDRRLGRGLEFFLSSGGAEPAKRLESESEVEAQASPEVETAGPPVGELEVGRLSPNPFQPRREFAARELDELARSIQSTGVLQPILVRKAGADFQIIAGERRWRAAKKAGLATIPAVIRDISDEQAALFGLVENLQREDLNPIEKAQAFQKILELTKGRQEDVARQVGLDRSTVANFLRLLELPADVQGHVSRGTLSMGHARALLGLATAEERVQVAGDVVKRKLSVRQLETLVQELNAATDPNAKKRPVGSQSGRPVWVSEIEETLTSSLGTNVRVRYAAKRSSFLIECAGRSEFERIYERLKASEKK